MKEAIDYNRLKDTILSIKDFEVQAIAAYQYALACRLGELFLYKHKPYRFAKEDRSKPFKDRRKIYGKEYNTLGLTQDCFHEFEDHWEITLPIFKQHEDKPVYGKTFLLKQGKEDWLTNICLNWKNQAGHQLFTMSYEAARKRLKKILEKLPFDYLAQKTMSSHNLRDSRANHFLKLYGFNIVDIRDILHHKSLEATKLYLSSSIEERKNKLKLATQ